MRGMGPNSPEHPSALRRRAAVLWAAVLSAAAVGLAGCGGEAEADGRALFATNCAVCHGVAGEGNEQGPPLTDARYLPDQLSDAGVAAAIRNGVPEREFEFGPMPGFSRFDDREIDAIVEVVRELQGEAGAG